MPERSAPALTAHFWRTMAGAVVVGVLLAFACALFFVVENLMTSQVWGGQEAPVGLFTGSLTAVAIVLVASVVVGLLRKHIGASGPDPDFMSEMIEGEVPPRRGIRYAVLGLVSLVGGASVGPEAPLGTIGAAVGTAVGRRFGRTDEATEDMTFSGISGVFGALVTFPLVGPLMAMETHHDRWQNTPSRLLPGVVSAATSLAVLYPLLGTPFLSVYGLGDPDLEVSWILTAMVLGVLGAVLGVLTAVVMGISSRVGQKIRDPLARAVVAGVAIATIGFVLPVTLFSGRDALIDILQGGPGVTVGLLVFVLVGKLLTFVLSMRWGFFGGPIFPLVFLGATAGAVVHLLVPGVPLVVAVPALAGAVAAALTPLPLSVMVLTTLMFGLSVELSVVPALAVVTASVVVRGTGVLERLQPSDG